jgi:glycosyltransferase involved in cell wall biosynthesis
VAIPSHPPATESAPRRFLNAQPSLLGTALRANPALVHATGGEPLLGWPAPRQVVTVHDVYPWRALDRGAGRARRSYLAWQRRRLRRVGTVIAVSDVVAQDASQVLGIDPARIHVVAEGVSAVFSPEDRGDDTNRRARLGVGGEPYAFWVGSLRARDPRKGLDSLLEAVAALGDAAPVLVLAGDAGAEARRLEAAASSTGVGIRLVGRVSDEDLAALYRGAGVVVVPSLDEGFGLPLLEAMACAAPVVASRAGNLPNLAGDGALLVKPGDATDLARGIRAVLAEASISDRLRALAPGRAAGHTWKAAAEATFSVYRQAAVRQ